MHGMPRLKRQYDVIVVGGGTAGVIAAIQAARAGASTLVVEKNGMLGGTMTIGGINYPAHFFAWGNQIIGGIGWELFCRTCAENGQPLPEAREGSRHLLVDLAIYACVCDEAVFDAGADVLFHAMPAGASSRTGVESAGVHKRGLRSCRAKVVIDATGDANVVAGRAGIDSFGHRSAGDAHLRRSGYDPDVLDYAALKTAADKAIAAGELVTTDVAWFDDGPEALLRKHGHNSNHVYAPEAHTSEGRSRAEAEGRKALLRMYRFLRRQPGLENFRIDWVCPEIGIRETVTIRGKKTITASEYESGFVYDDALCYAFYHIDEHLNHGRGINTRPLKRGVFPTIPRGALLPADSRFMLAPGRCVASDREANSALRVECPCMAMGQAAGAMAALSARAGVDVEELPISDVRAMLREYGAIVPGDQAMIPGPPGAGDA